MMQNVAFWFGMGLVIAGLLMFAFRKESAAENGVEILGMRFKLSHPTLVIIVLGFVLVVNNPFVPEGRTTSTTPAKPPGDTTSTKPPGDTTSTTPAKPPGDTTSAAPAKPSGDTTSTTPPKPPEPSTTSTAPAKPPERDTTSTTPAKPPKVKVREIVTTPSPTWVFLGTAEGKALPSKTFKLTEFPVPGQEIEAVTPVKTRVTAPFKKDGDHWYFGREVGFLREGDRVSVRRLTTVKMSEDEPEYIWAEVEVVSKPAH